MKLSIITPYYNTLEYIKNLAGILIPQLTNDTEWIIVDDGCNEKELDKYKEYNNVKVIHLKENSGTASIPRNKGLSIAKGKYIAFIDSDDLVSHRYIQVIRNKIDNEDFDYCYISWKGKSNTIIIVNEPPKWNCCVWNCIYKQDIIGKERFNPIYKMAEDYDFNDRVRKGKKANITEILYYYNEETPNSLTKQGQLYNDKYKEEK